MLKNSSIYSSLGLFSLSEDVDDGRQRDKKDITSGFSNREKIGRKPFRQRNRHAMSFVRLFLSRSTSMIQGDCFWMDQRQGNSF